MFGSYGSFLNYLEIRRRIERRLMPMSWLGLHILLFVAVDIFALSSYTRHPSGMTFASLSMAQVMLVWSVVLLAHGVWSLVRSGAWTNRRSRVIEQEMRERFEQADTYLVQDERDWFRIHGLLENDVRARSSAAQWLTLFTVINALNWIGSGGGYMTSYPWQITPMLALVLVPVLAFAAWRSGRRERKLVTMLSAENAKAGNARRSAKRKHKPTLGSVPDYLQLVDSDEMLEIIDADADADVETDEQPRRLKRK